MGTNDDTSKDSGFSVTCDQASLSFLFAQKKSNDAWSQVSFSAASDAKPKRPAFSGIVGQSDRDTLLLIIRTHISPGTRVMSDMWKPYDCQKDEGHTHLTINHNLNFADPDTGAHIQRNENTWWGVKPSSCGVSTMETILLPKHYQAYRRLICVNIVRRSPVPGTVCTLRDVIATSRRKETKYTASTHGTVLEEGNQEEKTPKDTMKVSNYFISLQFSFMKSEK